MADTPNHSDRTAEHLADIEQKAQAGDLGGFGAAITRCLAPPKVIHEVAATPAFWQSVESLLGRIPADNDHSIALALAELGRLHASLKSKTEQLQPLAARVLEKRVPAHFSHGDADVATFAAKGWACSGRPADVAVAVRTAVMAEAPKPLVPWLELALSAGNVSAVLEGIASCLRESAPLDAKQGKKRASRLQRLLRALRSALDADRVALDSDVPKALADLTEKGFRGVHPPQYADGAKAVDELMSLALHLIRMDFFQLLTEPAIYNSVGAASGWLPSGGWRRFTRSSVRAARLRKDLLNGLVFLLKQGHPNRPLLESHQMLSADAAAALAELKAAAEADRTIPAKLRSWLASGGKATITGEEQTLSETDDTVIGMALLAVEGLARCEFFRSESPADGPIKELVEGAREAHNRVLSVAVRRDLRVFGAPGEVVKFSPQLHRLVGTATAPDQVVIVDPGVECLGSFGKRVVVPAVVEAR